MRYTLLFVLIFFNAGYLIAQSKVFSTDQYGFSATQVWKIEDGKIYSTDQWGSLLNK